MSASKVTAGAAIIVVATAAALNFAGPARADGPSGINGTYATSSNGEWAKSNERYQEQPSERSTWTVATSCTAPTACAGTVTSDQGWSAPIYTTNGLWYVKRVLPAWRFCADGTPIEGLQIYKLYPVGADGLFDRTASEYAGENFTTGPSGSCGRNQWPAVRMPFYMTKL